MELIDKKESAVAVYAPFYAQLTELELNNSKLVFNYEDKKGNKEARSHVNTLRLTKGALERTRKEAKADSLRIGRAIDSEAQDIGARIESMIGVHMVKLDEIEKRETDRIAAIRTKLAALSEIHLDSDVKNFKYHIATLESVVIDDSWQEFIAEAAQAKDASIAKHRELLAAREKADAEAAELLRLRQESEARAQQDRDTAIAKAAAETAQREAAELAGREARKAAQAIADAEDKAKREREAANRRELEFKLQVEQAERRRVEAEQKAVQDAINAAAQAERDKDAAIKAEQDRVAAVIKEAAAATAKREANVAHKKKVNNAALAALVAGGIAEDYAKSCITLIASGKIPAVEISY